MSNIKIITMKRLTQEEYRQEVCDTLNIDIKIDTYHKGDITLDIFHTSDDYEVYAMYEGHNVKDISQEVFYYEENLVSAFENLLMDSYTNEGLIIQVYCWDDEEITDKICWEDLHENLRALKKEHIEFMKKDPKLTK